MKKTLKTKHQITESDIDAIKDIRYKYSRLGHEEIARRLGIQKTVLKKLLVPINRQRDAEILDKKAEVNADFISGLSKSEISRKHQISYPNVNKLLQAETSIKEINRLYFDYSHMGMPFAFG